MSQHRIPFDELPWEISPSGSRYKIYRNGSTQLRLLEFGPDLDHPGWCATGHIGYIIEGSMELEFDNETITFNAGDALHIPAGEHHRHRPRAVTERVRMIFLEETPTD